MRARNLRTVCLSSAPYLLLDTSIVLSILNNDPSEKESADKANEIMDKHPHSPRLIVSPCLVELVYKIRKRLSGKDLQRALQSQAIELFPTPEGFETETFNHFAKITNKNEYDYADFFLCRTGLLFPSAKILTRDRDDLPLALSRAYTTGKGDIQLVPL